jgi:hypothetical protein
MLRQKSRRYNGNGSYVPLKMQDKIQDTSSLSSKQQHNFILQQRHSELWLRR